MEEEIRQLFVPGLFEEQADRYPGRIAVKFQNISLTYGELNRQANQLAHLLLHRHGVYPQEPVGILLDRSERMIVAVLAVLKSGCAYIPLSPGNPVAYNTSICDDCGLKLILTDQPETCKGLPENISLIDMSNNEIFKGDAGNLSGRVKAGQLAYIIFTSGSTGRPKGVMIEHGQLAYKLLWMQQTYPLTGEDSVLQKTNFVFDVSVWELLWPITSGACLCFLPAGEQAHPDRILETLYDSQISIVHFVPAMLQVFLNYLEANPTSIERLSNIKRVFTSGEALTVTQVNLFNQLIHTRFGTGLTNQYGPTEATIEVSYFDCESTAPVTIVPIGMPIPNTRFYVMDENEQPVPDGEAGELYIAGPQVARGYINRPDQNFLRFKQDSFYPGDRYYKTGDRVRRMPGNTYEFFGRIDDQLKVNGYRVEPQAIENVILENKQVNAAVVVLKNIDGIDELAAYFTLKAGSGGPSLHEALTNALKAKLPYYMVPAFFTKLLTLPVNSNGKIDRKALPLPAKRFVPAREGHSLPVTDTEKKIAAIWESILQMDNAGIDDNFFQMGGRSLLAIKLVSQLNKTFAVIMSLSGLFHSPTIRQLAEKIDGQLLAPESPLILLKHGEGPPIFMFPGWRDDPAVFSDFVLSYQGDNALYGVVYPQDSEDFTFRDLQEYGVYIMSQIKKIYPAGPYGLLGHSLGGRISFEVALQLQNRGDEIFLLAIAGGYPAYHGAGNLVYRKIRDEVHTFAMISLKLKMKYLANRVPNALTFFVKGELLQSDDSRYEQYYRKLYQLWESYSPAGLYKGDIILFYENIDLNQKNEFKRLKPYRTSVYGDLWKEWISGQVFEQVLDSKHVELMQGPAAGIIASFIAGYLEKMAEKAA